MADQRAQWTEAAVGANHPTKADTINRLALVEHNNDGTHAKLTQVKDPYVDVRAFGLTKGSGVDNSTAIQSAIDYANSIATSSQTRSAITVFIPEGDYGLSSQVVVKAHVNLHCDGVLHNNLTDKWQAAVWCKAGSHCGKLQIWGNLGSGVVFGEGATYCNMQIGDVRLWNIGEEYDGVKGSKTGVKFTGYNFTFDSIDCDGGNVGVDLNLASDVRGNKIISFTASTALRITSACEHIYLTSVDIDTPDYKGLQIDSSHDIWIGDCGIFLNDQSATGNLANAVVIGEYSASDKVNNLRIGLRVQNTGAQALKLFNMKNSFIQLLATNATLATGNAHPITSALEFGAGVEATVMIDANVDGISSLITGTGGCVRYTVAGASRYYGPDNSIVQDFAGLAWIGTPANGGRVRRYMDSIANTTGNIEIGETYNCALNSTTGVWAGRDVTGPCWLEKWTDDGGTKELWYAPSAAAGVAPVWEKKIWIDLANGRIVGGKIFACQHTPISIVATTSVVTLYSVTIPGGTLGKNGVLKINTWWTHRNNSSVKTFQIYYGGQLFSSRSNTTIDSMSFLSIIKNRNNEASQIGIPEVQYMPYNAFTAPWAVWKIGSVNTAVDQLIEVKGNVALEPSKSVTSITRSGTTATATSAAHGYANGDYVLIAGANETQYNGTFTISNVTTNTFDYTVSGSPATPATGTITVQRYGLLTLEAVTVEVER